MAGGGPEVGAYGVGDWDQRRLHHLVERDPQQLGRLPLVAQVEGGPTPPSPRARAASMKLQAAGMIDPHREACTTTGAWSVRPSTHGITWTGTWWMWWPDCGLRRRGGRRPPGELRGRFPARGRLAVGLAGR
jgi:hypothetical protein